MYRDWSAEGAVERRASHDLLLQDLETEFSTVSDRAAIKVLVPGAGLGRLVLDICVKGFWVEGNEISFHQMIASNWVLNSVEKDEQWDLYPFVTDFSNVISRNDQFQVVKIPDVHPGTMLEEASVNSRVPCAERLSMVAGDFISVYGDHTAKGVYDAVVTMFFIDTAPNLIKYVETIMNCLKLGGVWMNLGPLQWHFEDRGAAGKGQKHGAGPPHTGSYGIAVPGCFELSNEEVFLLIEQMGFHIEKHEIRNDGTGYIHNASSMLHNNYRNSHWIARKQRGV